MQGGLTLSQVVPYRLSLSSLASDSEDMEGQSVAILTLTTMAQMISECRY